MSVYRLPGPCLVLEQGGRQSGHCACGAITSFVESDASAPVGQHRDCSGLAYPDGRRWLCTGCGHGVPASLVDVIPAGDARLAWHCYVATCDSRDCRFCGDLLMGRDGDDDPCAVHGATPGDLAGLARDYGWRITADLGAYCPDSELPNGAVLLGQPA
jgi:hypothetical protein